MNPEGFAQGLELPAGARPLFVSGQIRVRADGTVPDGFAAQCHTVLGSDGDVEAVAAA